MHFGFALELSDIDLWNTDLLDTDLDLLSPDKYTDIPSKYFACLHKTFKTSSRHVFKASSRHVFETCLQDVFKTCLQDVFKTCLQDVFKTSSRRLQRSNFSSSKTSSRRLQDILEDVKLLRWRRVEDVFKTNKCLLGLVVFWISEISHEHSLCIWEQWMVAFRGAYWLSSAYLILLRAICFFLFLSFFLIFLWFILLA